MAHPQQQNFCNRVKSLFPHLFALTNVVDFGSLDINGSNKGLFSDAVYVGVDRGPGKNVDVVSLAHEYFPPFPPDVVISTEMLEHDQYWEKSLQRMLQVLKPGGLLVITCATTGRPEHGTRRSDIGSSPYTGDYYQNLTEADFRKALAVDEEFSSYEFSVDHTSCDLYFWGVKKEELE